MLPFRWAILYVALLIALAQGASINSAVNGGNVKSPQDIRRSKRSYKRGQTQSQYLNFGQPELDGKAEAEATENGSRSTVSGTHGMGQAQSQFSSGDCSGCGISSPVYEYSTRSPDPLTLSRNVPSYSDGKPPSPSGGAFGPGRGSVGTLPQGTGSQVVKPGRLGQPSVISDFAHGTSIVGAPGVGGNFAPGAISAGQRGKPGTGSDYAPGSGYGSSNDNTEQIAGPETSKNYAQGGVHRPHAGEVGQIRKPGSGGAYAPGGGYSPSAGNVGQTGTPETAYTLTSRYGPGTSHTRQPVSPETAGAYIPGGGYIDVGQTGKPRTGEAYTPHSGYGLGTDEVAQTGRPATGGAYAPSPSVPRQTAPSIGSNYGPGAGIGNVGHQGAPGVTISGTGVLGPQGKGQRQHPYLNAPLGQDQVEQSRADFGPQVPTYGHDGSPQISTTIPGAGYTQLGADKQQVRQYGNGGQISPNYGTDGSQPIAVTSQPNQQKSSYMPPGHGEIIPQSPGRHVFGQQITQPGSYNLQIPQYGSDNQAVRYPQQSSYGGRIAETESRPGAVVQPGVQYHGPEQIVQQPGAGINRFNGYQQGLGETSGIIREPVNGFQPGYRTPLTVGYGQPGKGIQSGIEAGYQSGVGLGQPGVGIQQNHFQPSGDFIQPGQIQSGSHLDTPTTQIQPGTGFILPNAGSQDGGFQTVSGITPPGLGVKPGVNIQPGEGYSTRGTGTGVPQVGQHGLLAQSGGRQPAAGVGQSITNYQPGPTGQQDDKLQTHGYTPVYGPQSVPVQYGTNIDKQPQTGRGAGGGYLTGMIYGQPNSGPQNSNHLNSSPQTLESGFGQVNNQLVKQSGVQPGAMFSQYQPGIISVPASGGPHNAGVQGSSFGNRYDTGYGQQTSDQTGAGYGQPSATTQYIQPGYGTQITAFPPGNGNKQPAGIGAQLPGAAIQTSYGHPSGASAPQYGQSPQQMVQPSSTYIPGDRQASGGQQGIAGLGGLAGSTGGADDAFSQAESSIGNGQAAASAQGKKNGGTAKTQVQGTYSSSGSFSASAMTSDNDRSASSQVTGGVEGAMSQSQGQGGAAQSQAQVQINEKTGGTKASSQSGGIIHQSQSEVQANDKGGLADAQSSGPGQTSSQAQIGFRPGQDGEIVRSSGGGQASAQSGVHSGNSQSQIQGTSKYGVSYHGAAQSASGTKEQVATYREQNRDLFNTISQFGSTDAITDRVDTVYNPSLTSESDNIPDLQLKASRPSKEETNSNKLDDDSILTDEDDEEPYDEYDDEEDYYNENPIKMETKIDSDKKLQSSPIYRTHTQTSPTQTQQVAVADSTKRYNVVQNQNGRVQTYSSRTTTETVPSGFRGTVNVEKKFHTKSLELHKSENKLNITANQNSVHNPHTPHSFVTVTKSITGSMDNSKNPPQDNKNFQSTYYTKSSTCGYFTFSCNIVYGANGRSKICRPKAPTNGKC